MAYIHIVQNKKAIVPGQMRVQEQKPEQKQEQQVVDNPEQVRNIHPGAWGPCGWKFLYFVCQSYPDKPTPKIIKTFKTFLTNIKYILPCERCRYNYCKHLKIAKLCPDSLENRNSLITWFYNIDCLSRIDIGKEPRTVEEFFAYYNNVKNDY